LEWKVTDVGIDWYAGTTTDPKTGRDVIEQAERIIEGQLFGDTSNAHEREQGYFGLRSPSAFVGERDDSVYLRLSGSEARTYWADFAAMGLRASRADVQVTARASEDIRSYVEKLRDDDRNGGSPVANRRRVRYFSDSSGGDTLYVGSPRSDRLARIYDKARESPNAYPIGSWRWEVQYRHKSAQAVSRDLLGRETHEDFELELVADYFRGVGLPAPWPVTMGATQPVIGRHTTTNAARVKWLRRCVAPMIERLKAEYSVELLRKELGLNYNPPKLPYKK
jgi:DNA relaxase NicK